MQANTSQFNFQRIFQWVMMVMLLPVIVWTDSWHSAQHVSVQGLHDCKVSLSPTHLDTFPASTRSKNNNRYYSEFLDGSSNFFDLQTWSPKHDPNPFPHPAWRGCGSRCHNWRERFPAFYNKANKHKMITKVLFLQLVVKIPTLFCHHQCFTDFLFQNKNRPLTPNRIMDCLF